MLHLLGAKKFLMVNVQNVQVEVYANLETLTLSLGFALSGSRFAPSPRGRGWIFRGFNLFNTPQTAPAVFIPCIDTAGPKYTPAPQG